MEDESGSAVLKDPCPYSTEYESGNGNCNIVS